MFCYLLHYFFRCRQKYRRLSRRKESVSVWQGVHPDITVQNCAWYDSTNVWAVNAGTPGNANEKLMWGYLDSNGAANSGTNLLAGQNQPFFAVADLLKPHRAQLGLKIFQCPMAPVLGQGRWVQRSQPIKNPFFGASMPNCGTELP